MRVLAAVLCVAALACSEKESAKVPPVAPKTDAASAPAPAVDAAAKAEAPTPDAAPLATPPPPAALGLPRAEDVLPKGEVSQGSVVVTGDGFRYQIPPEARRIEIKPGLEGYTWTAKGFASEANLVVFVEKTPFKGKLDAMVEAGRSNVEGAGGSVLEDSPAQVTIAGKLGVKGHRLRVKHGGMQDQVVYVVHDGIAYVHHCQTPDVPNAWANVGSDCVIRGVTFHVAPPAK